MSEVVKKYRRPDVDGGYLSDPSEIAYYKHVQVNDVINNNMLGDYNEKGNYVVSKKIISELLGLKKVMQHSFGKTLFCTSAQEIKNYGTLELAVKIQTNKEDGNNEAVASLELLEPINKVGGYYQNTNTATIASYTDTYDSKFIEKVYLAFNITTKKDGYQGRKRLEEDIKAITDRKDYLQALKKQAQEGLEDAEKKFYEKRLAALNKSGNVGKSILVKLQLEANKVNKIFLKKGSKNYYKKMNQLLDKVLDESKKPVDKNLIDDFNKAQNEYIQSQKMVLQKATDSILEQQVLPKQVVINEIEQQKAAKNQEKPFNANFSKGKQKVTRVNAEKVDKYSNNQPQESSEEPMPEESKEDLDFVNKDGKTGVDKSVLNEHNNTENKDSTILNEDEAKPSEKKEIETEPGERAF
jgi:hypothetical protein